jgi:hypothetical protein
MAALKFTKTRLHTAAENLSLNICSPGDFKKLPKFGRCLRATQTIALGAFWKIFEAVT